MKKIILAFISTLILTACEKPLSLEDDGNVVLTFEPSTHDKQTRGTISIGNYFEKLNVMLFDADGSKAFDKVKTQTKDDSDFGQMTLSLAVGTYTVVAVGHSSIKSATIKSPQMVQFTASDGEKLTDTFCHCGQVTIGEDGGHFSLVMNRVGAMLQLVFTDAAENIPDVFQTLKIDYTGGSANFNPTTFEGTTKSTQSESRQRNASGIYQAFTFPYQSDEGELKVTITALTADGTQIRQRVLNNVPVTRNRITTYTGHFFEPGDGVITQTGFGFSVNGDWDGTDDHTF